MSFVDFFLVPTATFRLLFVFVLLSHARRRVLHFQVTEHPSQEWTMQQIREAFPWTNRMESKIVTPHSAKAILPTRSPAFPNSSGAGQRCSGIESRGEARTRAHRGDCSGRRTSLSLPAPAGLVRRGRRSRLPALCLGLANQRVREPRPDLIAATNSSLHSPLCDLEHLARCFEVPSIRYSGRR